MTTYIHNLCVDGMSCKFTVRGDINIANALRRALLSDIVIIAPKDVIIRENTSCMPDEYIAHRIGLVPFKHVGIDTTNLNDAVASIKVHGRDVLCSDIVSNHFLPCRQGIIMSMTSTQTLNLDIKFEENNASKHSRFLPIGPIAYKQMSHNEVEIAFSSITNESPIVYLRSALASLQTRIAQTKTYVQLKRS